VKIALLTHKLRPPFIGGVDVYTDRVGRALQRQGHAVTYFAFDSSGAGSEVQVSREEHAGAPVYRLQFAFDALPKEAFDTVYNPEMGRIVREIWQDDPVDLLIVVNFYMITLAPVEAAAELGIPVAHIATDFVPVCRRGTYMRWDNRTCEVGESVRTCASCFTAHRPLGRLGAALLERQPEERLLAWAGRKESLPLRWARPYLNHVAVMERRLARIRPLRELISLIFAPTPYTGDVFVRNGFRDDQVQLLPFGVEPDNPLSRLQRTPSDTVRFLFLGRLQPYKGAHVLLEAFNSPGRPARGDADDLRCLRRA
jgi:glycosyltransferase involved in cell wall biosynthesis